LAQPASRRPALRPKLIRDWIHWTRLKAPILELFGWNFAPDFPRVLRREAEFDLCYHKYWNPPD
jgi:hypothetical protein